MFTVGFAQAETSGPPASRLDEVVISSEDQSITSLLAPGASETGMRHEHGGTADSICSLADLYRKHGNHNTAAALYRTAIGIYETTVGVEHPASARAWRSLALVEWARRRPQRALRLLQQAQRAELQRADAIFPDASASRASDYQRLLGRNAFTDVTFAMSNPGSAATELSLTSVLNYKGRALDAVFDRIARLRESAAPADQVLLAQLADVAGQLSRLLYSEREPLPLEAYRARFLQLSMQREQLEAELASRSKALRGTAAADTLNAVRQAIPLNAVLLEWFEYVPLDPDEQNLGAHRAPRRYVVYVIKRNVAPVVIDMGEAERIDDLARQLRAALAHPGGMQFRQHSAALYAKLLAPLRAHLRDAEHILFAPDGELSLVPMAALLDESGAYLSERFTVSNLSSGRDLLRVVTTASAHGDAVVLANPDYGTRLAPVFERAASRRQRSIDLEQLALVFRPLAGTALEARDLAQLLKLDPANVLLSSSASETQLKKLKHPRILHIASHGFFLPTNAGVRGSLRRLPVTRRQNPLLRSGIALAGANERRDLGNDGILTGLEAVQLDLSGTELVVLSTCDSAIGDIQSGEGVYGMGRAFALAGARTQITSLWKVSDAVTHKLMVKYYSRLLAGEGRATAMRSAQRAILATADFAHPYYWASFIVSGNWHPIVDVGLRRLSHGQH